MRGEPVRPAHRPNRNARSRCFAILLSRPVQLPCEVAHGAPVYAPGVLEVDDNTDQGGLVACVTPNGAAVCLGRLVGDPDSTSGTVVDLERVLV